ncbi:Wzz/FepE/Etk N-terminal domain-containing protein, partial [Aliarcobacter butzleri]
MQNQKYLQEDEIDLKELFKTIWSYKKFILIFTFIVTVLSIIYVSSKTPTYEVTALVEVGSYKTESDQDIIIDNADNLSKK